jgi:hypothetical protein
MQRSRRIKCFLVLPKILVDVQIQTHQLLARLHASKRLRYQSCFPLLFSYGILTGAILGRRANINDAIDVFFAFVFLRLLPLQIIKRVKHSISAFHLFHLQNRHPTACC